MSEETKYELVKFIDNELELEVSVSPKEETVWLSLEEMSSSGMVSNKFSIFLELVASSWVSFLRYFGKFISYW